MKKLFIFLCIILAVITIYYFAKDDKIYYVSMGDYLSKGITSNNKEEKGYSDYLKDLLEENNSIKFYTKAYSDENYRIIDLINDIKNNVVKDDIPIQQALDKANYLTISTGSNDIFYKMGIKDMNYNLSNLNNGYAYVEEVINDMKKLFELTSKYTNAKVYVVGLYNPLSVISTIYARDLEPLFLYANEALQKLCEEYDYTYIDIYSLFKENVEFLPNKSSVYPNLQGYEAIARQIFSKM